jgi:hypothetical protein
VALRLPQPRHTCAHAPRLAAWRLCRDKNAFKTINAAPGSAVAKAAAASLDAPNTADVFSRRHTVSKVYWATKKRPEGAAGAEAQKQQEQQQQQQQERLRRTSSGAADVELLKGSLKRMDPAELIKVGGRVRAAASCCAGRSNCGAAGRGWRRCAGPWAGCRACHDGATGGWLAS